MTIKCKNWDSNKPEGLYFNGKCIGRLMPRLDKCVMEVEPREPESAEIINLAAYRRKTDA